MVEVILLLALAGMTHAVRSFTDGAGGGAELAFGFLLLTAFLAGRTLNRFGMPKLTGYLLVGVLSGASVLALVTKGMTSSLAVVNHVATCILGLTAGGELNLKRVAPLMGTLRAITVLGVVMAMFALAALLFLMRPFLPVFDDLTFGQGVVVCGLLGVALAAQSPAVVMALLSETRADGPLSRIVLATVVVADLVVVVVYSLLAAVAGALMGGGDTASGTLMSIGWELFGSMGFGVMIGAVIALYLRYVERGAPMFALMVCVVVAEIGGHVDLDPLIVMLAAGVWLENFSRVNAGKLLRGFEAAELPVFLVFFALGGVSLDLSALWGTIVPVILIVAARSCVFYFGCRAACARTYADPAIAKYGWTGLVPQAGLSFVLVAVIRQTFPKFGDAAAVLLMGVVAVNLLFAPVMLRMALVKTREAGKRAEHAFTD